MAYLYISDAKVNEILERRSPELGDRIRGNQSAGLDLTTPQTIPFIPIPLPSLKLQRGLGLSRVEKLRKAVEYLNEQRVVGSVEQPAGYFHGVVRLLWSPFKFDENRLVFFGGTIDRTLVAMGGSHRHVLGFKGDDQHYPGPELPLLWHYLGLDQSLDPGRGESELLQNVQDIVSRLGGIETPRRQCRFVAVNEGQAPMSRLPPEKQATIRESWGDPDLNRILFGSPVYVEAVEAKAT
jgi:hypothetical protein